MKSFLLRNLISNRLFSSELLWTILSFIGQFVSGIILIKLNNLYLTPAQYAIFGLLSSFNAFFVTIVLSPFLQAASRFNDNSTFI